jgi:hypothetical protein
MVHAIEFARGDADLALLYAYLRGWRRIAKVLNESAEQKYSERIAREFIEFLRPPKDRKGLSP